MEEKENELWKYNSDVPESVRLSVEKARNYDGQHANISTPGHKAKEISFQDTFRNKLKAATQTGDANDVRAAIRDSDYTVYERSDSARVDGNGVNVDVEYTELSRTALHYQYLLQSVNSDITRLRTAIKGQ